MTKYVHAGLIYGNDLHHLDHIAALCSILAIPLVVTDTRIEEIAHHYYPMVNTHYLSPAEAGLKMAEAYDGIFSSLPHDFIDEIFFGATLLGKNIPASIWVPHGNSDKGHASHFMEGLYREKLLLVYGEKMHNYIIEKVGAHMEHKAIHTGNIRYQFYKENTQFYDTLIKKELASLLQKDKKTLLYAPTWEDAEKSCSLFSVLPHLCESLPKDWNLIVKPHPNTLSDPTQEQHIASIARQKQNIFLMRETPTIYPLLSQIDAYIGDMSSIGYDFLTFNKPMFFLNDSQRNPHSDPGLYLFRCGRVIEPSDYKNIFPIIEKGCAGDQSSFETMQKKTYNQVFGREINISELRNTIYDKVNKLIESCQCMPRTR